MKKKFFTIEDLINFCQTKKIYNFSAGETGDPIVVQSVQDFSDANIEESDDGKLYAKVRVCHTLLNRNKSYISEESMLEAMPTLKYAPLLANIHQLDDGTWDFHSHDMHVEEDENGEEYVVYDEKQVGTFTADDPYLEYDEKKDKTYVVAKVAIPTEYSRTADIIKEKGGTKVSCELLIYECSFNPKENYLQLDHFRFNGCTCLGSEKDGTSIGEGMEGSCLSLEDFSEKNNSYLKFIEEKLDAMQTVLNNLDERFNIDNTTKGGTELKKENFEEEVTNTGEVTDTSEEEVTTTEEESEATVEETSEEETENNEEDSTEETTVEQEETFANMVRTYELSHEDIRYALYSLLYEYEETDNDWYFINAVYDDYFTYENWDGDKIFGQGYTKDGDNVAFDGERYNLHRELLTDSEYAELQTMRANYAELKAFKENVEKNELHAKREEIINSEKYAILAQKDEEGNFVNKDFADLVSEMDNFSLADLETKIKVLHSDYMSEHANFSAIPTKETKKKQVNLFGDINKNTKPRNRYGNLFNQK